MAALELGITSVSTYQGTAVYVRHSRLPGGNSRQQRKNLRRMRPHRFTDWRKVEALIHEARHSGVSWFDLFKEKGL